MYYLIENPYDRQVYLCEREPSSFLHIWDREGREVRVVGVPIVRALRNLVRRYWISNILRRYEKQLLKPSKRSPLVH